LQYNAAMSPKTLSQVTVRRATAADVDACAPICYEAFCKINADHNFPSDIPTPEIARHILSTVFSHPGHYSVVAELEGKIAGSNAMDERSIIFGVGPITVDPGVQNRGVGRALMQNVLDRARERKAAGVRLVQAAFHNRSLSLYTSLGFDAREPLSVFQGPALRRSIEGCYVRKVQAVDIPACSRVARRVHGFDRAQELSDALNSGHAVLVERQGRVTGYATDLAFFGHAVAESNLDLQALIASAEGFGGPGILVPTRNAELFRWCLANGLRVVEPMTLMSVGLYNEPTGAWLPSISF
jgi:predicted N-acetyltransferase YhbS